MEPLAFLPLLWWSLGAASVLGAGVYAYAAYQALLLRTAVQRLPEGGMRFSAHAFSLETRPGARCVALRARHGRPAPPKPAPEAPPAAGGGTLDLSWDACGLRFAVTPMQDASTRSCLTVSRVPFRTVNAAADTAEETLALVEQVPGVVAVDFLRFIGTVQLWIAKLERQILQEEQAQALQRAVEHAFGALVVEAPDPNAAVLEPNQREARARAQLQRWRQIAGFEGTSTEVSIDPYGAIHWLIDLEPGGRVILAAQGRTYHGSLRASQVRNVGSELELLVAGPAAAVGNGQASAVPFRILGGATPETRRAWRERLEIVIRELQKGSP